MVLFYCRHAAQAASHTHNSDFTSDCVQGDTVYELKLFKQTQVILFHKHGQSWVYSFKISPDFKLRSQHTLAHRQEGEIRFRLFPILFFLLVSILYPQSQSSDLYMNINGCTNIATC